MTLYRTPLSYNSTHTVGPWITSIPAPPPPHPTFPTYGAIYQGSLHIIGVLGHTSSTALYRARLLTTGELVVCKVHRASSVQHGAGRTTLPAGLHSRFIPSMMDSGVDDHNNIWWTRRDDPGRPLDRILNARRRPLRPRTALSLVAQLLAGLVPVHARGEVHGNLKPSNILVLDLLAQYASQNSSISNNTEPHLHIDPKSTVQLIDFCTPDARASTFHPNNAIYAAPEQLAGQAPSPNSDVYTMGAVLFEMITGRAPFMVGSSLDELHASKQAHPLALLSSTTGHRLDGRTARLLIRSMTSSEYRYQDASEFLADILRHPIHIHPKIHETQSSLSPEQLHQEALQSFAQARSLFVQKNVRKAYNVCARALRFQHRASTCEGAPSTDQRIHLETLRLFARINTALGAPSQAMEALNKALNLCEDTQSPLVARLFEQRAWVAYTQRDFAQCQRDLSRAEDLTPDTLQTRLARLRIGQALCSIRQDRWTDAQTQLARLNGDVLEGTARNFHDVVMLLLESTSRQTPFQWVVFDALVERLHNSSLKNLHDSACLSSHLVGIALSMGDTARALGCAQRTTAYWETLQNTAYCAESLLWSAHILRLQHHVERAQEALDTALKHLSHTPTIQTIKALQNHITLSVEHDSADTMFQYARELAALYREDQDAFSEAALYAWLLGHLDPQHPEIPHLTRSLRFLIRDLHQDVKDDDTTP